MNRQPLLGLAMVAVLFGTACSNGDDDPAQVDSVVEEGEAGADDEQASGDADTGEDTSTDDADRNGDPAGTARAQLPSTDDRMAPLRIDVVDLRRSGDLVELEMTLTNEADPADGDPVEFTPWDTFSEGHGIDLRVDLSGVGLIDPDEQKIYLPVYDSENRCLCTENLGAVSVVAGESLSLNATFGGVPEDIDTLDVHVPAFPAIVGIGVDG